MSPDGVDRQENQPVHAHPLPKCEQPAAKRQQIIVGAETVFTESGYEGASMSRIAMEAGVSKGTLYNYFASKSALFAAFVEHKAAISLATIFQIAQDENDLAITLHGIGLRMMEMILSAGNLVLYRIIISEAGKFPHLAEVFYDAGPRRAIRFMEAWLTRRIEDGLLVVPDPTIAAEQFFALCQTRVTMQRRLQLTHSTSPEEIDQVVRAAVHMFLTAFATDPLVSAPSKN
ncbi:TetR/AcrR family transcriptional regulator [Lichenicoccus roseus]|uniref:TetR/AcrR family transcriptional regulator n=1 Tax=Lichenicoccus roseus TaxID=2683649 RepID=UPI001486027A|nr:TetR/AcrR family transcriptional regulator [Lichenicoccus roseus]